MSKTINHSHLKLELQSTERAAIRAEVFKHWIAEKPGSTTERNTYRYDVELLCDGSIIYLTRPTRLNKGADFVIHCQNFVKFKNGNDKPPKHSNLIDELQDLVSRSANHEKEILKSIGRIWDCESSAKVIADLKFFAGEMKAERVLLLAKWFFIEQDVTYWTESGRHMLRTAFEDEFGNIS
jgi:hypothetical protein